MKALSQFTNSNVFAVLFWVSLIGMICTLSFHQLVIAWTAGTVFAVLVVLLVVTIRSGE